MRTTQGRLFNSLALLVVLLGLTLLASACSHGNDITGNSPLSSGNGSLRSTADDTPVVVAGIQETNDAPQGFTFVLQGEQHADYTQSVFVAWRPFVGVGKYETSFERYDVDNVWRAVPSIFTNSPTKFQAVLIHGKWRSRTRSLYATHEGRWTTYKEQSIQSPPASVEVVTEDCDWEQEFPGIFKLVFRRR